MGAIKRLAVDVACPSCARANRLLMPEASCGNEFVWHARCGGCGDWRWFHSREDIAFVRSIKETAKRRSEREGLSPEGTREAHAAFAATVDACACGGRFHVVREMTEEPCLGCGRPLKDSAFPEVQRVEVRVTPLRPAT